MRRGEEEVGGGWEEREGEANEEVFKGVREGRGGGIS